MIDLHCHILPDIDDGPKSADESKEMLSIAAKEGIRIVAATPHYMEEQSSVNVYLELMDKKIQEVQPAQDTGENGIKIVRGAEVYISPDLPKLSGLERLCLAGSRYLLLELPMLDIPQYVEDVVYHLRLNGILPIIAHPERYLRVQEDPNLFCPLIEMGALGQVNTGSITGFFGNRAQRCARILFDHNMAHMVGTDAHSSKRRAPRMKEAVRKLDQWLGPDKTDEIVNRTPPAILKDVFLEMDSPIRYRKRVLHFLF